MERVLMFMFLFGGGTLFLLAISPVGRAIADRIRHKGRVPAADDGLQAEVLDELQALRQEVAELAERVDFTERMLAKGREAEKLPPAR